MKNYAIFAAIALISICSCKKNAQVTAPKYLVDTRTAPKITDTVKIVDSSGSVPYPGSTINAPGCPVMPLYGDSLIYPQPQAGQDDIRLPVNNPGPGRYFAWPAGMIIDHSTGAIDFTLSQSGLKYAIGFVSDGTTDTCLSTLILGGASYFDSVYVVSTGGIKSAPYFDANPAGGNYCGNGNGQGNGCKFDVTGSAARQRVSVNNSSGEIDLQKTLDGNGNAGGVFGASPFDGQAVTTTIYYQLKKGSNKAPQHIDVQFVYYASAASIPTALQASLDVKLANLLNGSLISTSINPRPPLIVIVRGL